MAFKKFEPSKGFQRQMFDVSNMNIKCCECGTPITQLAFDPDPERIDSIRCQDCMRKSREQRHRGFQRKMFDVSDMNIKCCDCGTPITQLAFDPDPERIDSIRCQDCMRKSREQRSRRF